MPKYADIRERIIANTVVAPEGMGNIINRSVCWLWVGALNSSGYPRMNVRMKRGPRKGKVVVVLVHRVVLTEFKSRVMSGRLKAMHLCNNPPCVNPDHLEGGTQRKNIRQCVQEGRHWSGFKGNKPK